MLPTQIRRRSSVRRGTVTVEFSLAAPVLFVFLFAILEFGRAQMIQHTLDNAVYEGVRRGMSINSTEAKVRERVTAITSPAAIRNPVVTVTLTPDLVTVSASINLNDNSLFSPLFLRNKTLNSSLTLSRR